MSPRNIAIVIILLVVGLTAGVLFMAKDKTTLDKNLSESITQKEANNDKKTAGQEAETSESTKIEFEEDELPIPEDPKEDIDQELNSLDSIIKKADPNDFGEDKLSDLEL